jgi:hypothetical protein
MHKHWNEKMPRQYEAMRDAFMKEGMAKKAAQSKAARIYNSKHPKSPVGRSSREDKEFVERMKR